MAGGIEIPIKRKGVRLIGHGHDTAAGKNALSPVPLVGGLIQQLFVAFQKTENSSPLSDESRALHHH